MADIEGPIGADRMEEGLTVIGGIGVGKCS